MRFCKIYPQAAGQSFARGPNLKRQWCSDLSWSQRSKKCEKQLRALRQTGRVAGYVQKFHELQYQLPGMTDEEAFIPSCLDCSRTCKSTWGPMCREIWRLPSQWPNVWRCTVVETGPRRVERDPRNSKIRKRECRRRSKGVRLGGPSRWSRLLKNRSKRRARAEFGLWWKEDQEGRTRKRFNATIVVATTSCEIARSGKKSKRNSVPPREKISPAPFAHMDGSPGWNPWTTREQRGRW